MSQSALRIRSELMLGPLAGWLLMALLAPGAAAQTVPADIAEVSIEALFASNVVTREERAPGQQAVAPGLPLSAL